MEKRQHEFEVISPKKDLFTEIVWVAAASLHLEPSTTHVILSVASGFSNRVCSACHRNNITQVFLANFSFVHPWDLVWRGAPQNIMAVRGAPKRDLIPPGKFPCKMRLRWLDAKLAWNSQERNSLPYFVMEHVDLQCTTSTCNFLVNTRMDNRNTLIMQRWPSSACKKLQLFLLCHVSPSGCGSTPVKYRNRRLHVIEEQDRSIADTKFTLFCSLWSQYYATVGCC